MSTAIHRVHATTVAVFETGQADAAGLVLLGPSGAGKSALALRLLALGARLVADDQTCLVARDDRLVASSPPALRGLIEARGVGLLRVAPLAEAPVVAAVDLGQTETARLPPPRQWSALGVSVPLLHGVASTAFPAALLAYLRQGRSDAP